AAHTGWIVGTMPPWIQYQNKPAFKGPVTYTDPIAYIKQQWGKWLCGTRYSGLDALNAAWGSKYTTCGSTATTASAETIGTGDGTTTTFIYTFLHGPIDPASVGVSVGGTLQGGDCPWFGNGCSGSSATGVIQSATGNINGGTINYSTKAITVTFSVPPPNGVAITATYQYS